MDLNHDQNNIQGQIDRNKGRIASLTEDLRESLRSKDSRIECLEERSKALEKEIQDLKYKNELLSKQLQEMKERMMNSEKETLEKETLKEEKLQKMEARLTVLEKENKRQNTVFIIMQIGTAIQRNMCKYVLREHFDDSTLYKFKEIERHIKNLKSEADKKAARKRLTEMNKKISWDQRLVNSLQILNQERISIAHPDLSSEKMQQATDFLKEENILRGRMVDDVNKLKELWETSEELLQTSSTEGHDQGLSQDKKHIRAMPSFTSSKASGKRLLPHRFFQSKGTD